MKCNTRRKPDWLKISLPKGKEYLTVKEIVDKKKLNTICVSGKCPNLAECWGCGTATFMILGNICTRSCKFCATQTGKPLPVDWDEAERLSDTIQKMKLKHCVITSVDRDDLEDGGADFWALTVKKIKEKNPTTTIETLIPDFNANKALIQKVIDAEPEIISHNMETVRRLTPLVRSRAKYDVSLKTIEHIANSKKLKAKSGIMVGLGETEEEVLATMDDLLAVGCKIFTIGQYLQPTHNNWPVHEYVKPEQFARYKTIGLEKGFEFVESAPLVRSSYHAEKHV
ncbi:MAG: lipoyl synthase [Bacteroidetes bacterium]|nr:MAG: lipoyl synthase [Bacteroidota bacterium]